MASQSVRLALLIGVVAATAVSSARADDAPKATDPCMRTVTCTEWVPERYTVKRKVYRVSYRKVACQSFRCERVCVQRDQVCNVVRRIPCYRTVTRKVCCRTWGWETRTVNRRCYQYKQVTCMVKKCVRRGHWECRQVETFMSKLQGCLGGLGGGGLCNRNNCCDPCDPCCNTRTHCPRYTSRKVWVNCPEYRMCPVTKCVKVCVNKPVCCKVRVCHRTYKTVSHKVCTYKCVTEQVTRKVNCWVTRKVPCTTYRCERVCVPHEETVTCCRMVPRTVTRQVPVSDCCNTCCSSSCCDPCCNTGCGGGCGLFNRLFSGRGSCGGGGCCH